MPAFRSFRLLPLFVICCVPAAAQSFSWTHFAGMPPQFGSSDGVGAAARFHLPTGIVGTTTQDVYLTDSLNHTIRRISPTGAVTTIAGFAGQAGSSDGMGANARFSTPTGITLMGGMLFVADRLNHVIRRVTIAGEVTTYAGWPGVAGSADGHRMNARFKDPTDVRGDASGNLYVTDRLNHAIRKIAPDGTVSTLAGLAGVAGIADGTGAGARFNAPAGLALDGEVLYVADTDNHTVRRIAADGTVTTIAGSPGMPGSTNGTGSTARFRFPYRLVVYSGGTIVLTDAGNDCLRLITPQGAVSVFAGRLDVPGTVDGLRTDARFFEPTGVAFYDDGLVVADSLNHSIRKISGNDQVTTLAGPGGNFGRVDGPPLVARFNYPNGISLHASGDVYLADTRGNTIRRIAPDGTVTRVGGQASGDAYVDGPAAVASLNYPHGLAVAPDRTVYFCEQQRHTIRVLHPDGSVSTLAGTEGSVGSADGAGAAARFHLPSDIARDSAGNLYIADTGNHTIRRIAAGGAVVTTFAGSAGNPGSADGMGATARFSSPRGVGVDSEDNIYVADTSNHTIRKITPAGIVTTMAGTAGAWGSADGAGAAARFLAPSGLAIDSAGRIFVADTLNHTVRLIEGNVVSTIGGTAGMPQYTEGTGNHANFFLPNGIAIDSAGVVYVVQHGTNLVMKGAIDRMPVITVPPQPVAVHAGASATLTISATGGGLSYQWRFNGTPIPGATNATYVISNVQPSAAGSYSVDITNSAGSTSSAAVTLSVSAATTNAGRLINLSILSSLTWAGDEFTLGYVVGGAGTAGAKSVLIRAAGPSLAQFEVSDVLADPKLECFAGTVPAGGNDAWGGTAALSAAFESVGAFAYISDTSLDAAAVATIQPGDNSVKISAANNGTGAVIAEIYDMTPSASFTAATPRLINVSVLKDVGSGLTAGFVLGGETDSRVLIRAIGPTIGAAPFNVPGAISNPHLTVFSGQTEIARNEDWGGTPELTATFGAVGAFELSPNSRDAAVVVTLQPGAYTVAVAGVGGTTGVALVEVYEVP